MFNKEKLNKLKNLIIFMCQHNLKRSILILWYLLERLNVSFKLKLYHIKVFIRTPKSSHKSVGIINWELLPQRQKLLVYVHFLSIAFSLPSFLIYFLSIIISLRS